MRNSSENGEIWAIIVTFNRLELLKRCVEAVRGQLHRPEKILVVNNASTDGTREWLDGQNDLEVIHQDNLGGAGGFHNGMKYAYDRGADFFWLMDDDGRPKDSSCLRELMRYIASIVSSAMASKEAVLLNSLVLADEDTLSFPYRGRTDRNGVAGEFVENWCAPFNGTLISRGLVDSIGYPVKEFFIKGDEAEYFLRSKRIGALCGTVTSSVFYHPEQRIVMKRVIMTNRWVPVEGPTREYYKVRNKIIIEKRYGTKGTLMRLLARQLVSIFAGSDRWLARTYFILRGMVDGLLGRYNNVRL